MNINQTNNAREVSVAIGDAAPRQVPYAAALMLTRLAGDVREGVQVRLPAVFDRPTEFTQRGIFTSPASKSQLESRVYVPESQDARGRSAREYIRPGATGGARNQKKTEFLLSRIGALPPGWVTTPGRGAQLDSYGNLPGSVYRQIINVLQIRYNRPKPVSGRSRKAASRLGVEALFFVVTPGANKLGKGGGWLPPGVWKHLPGGQITQILRFVRRATYRPRLQLREEALPVLQRQLAVRWREASTLISERFAAPRVNIGPGGATIR
ncbi:MAG TPA: hypothetical protein VEB23_14610 [Ramlibacter sp.]|nr:hypothetical protein [Ramlibacter sp.]